jgi:LacI family transcriptional regulator
MEDVCREKGYGLLVANLPGAPGHQSRILEMFDREGIKNVIIAPDVVHNEVRELVTGNRFKMSFVLMEEDIKGVCADSVTVNHFQGAYDAVSELIKLGRRRIGYIGNGRTDDLRNQERERGCRQAILDNGLPLDENLVMQYPFRSGVTPEPNDPMLRAYFMSDRRPDAVFVFCDANAITVCGFLSGAGVSIPDEVAVMGFDNSPACGSLKVPLSSVEQYPYELGAKAAELMISRIKGGAHRHKVKTVIRPTVILRESTQNKQ